MYAYRCSHSYSNTQTHASADAPSENSETNTEAFSGTDENSATFTPRQDYH